ncbi:MAG: glycosyltransferase [Oscillospiraceae bacterium]|jgi:glycosyltransferase involved in cell wall biosynthesis|nr:glycosyltransferase [Oscillospiraceae bacterium]
MRISIVLPAYNGERFLAEQIASIVPQMLPGDELLISDDSPEDNLETRRIAQSFAEHDSRVRCFEGPRKGVQRNVEFLLSQAARELVVLSDQDDVWLPNKLQRLRDVFAAHPDITLLVHDAKTTDAALNIVQPSYFDVRGVRRGNPPKVCGNILRNRFIGCCMAFRRTLLTDALPFPANIPMHDQWLGIVALKKGMVQWLHEPLLLYRRHEDAQTHPKASLRQQLQWRRGILRSVFPWEKRKN